MKDEKTNSTMHPLDDDQMEEVVGGKSDLKDKIVIQPTTPISEDTIKNI